MDTSIIRLVCVGYSWIASPVKLASIKVDGAEWGAALIVGCWVGARVDYYYMKAIHKQGYFCLYPTYMLSIFQVSLVQTCTNAYLRRETMDSPDLRETDIDLHVESDTPDAIYLLSRREPLSKLTHSHTHTWSTQL